MASRPQNTRKTRAFGASRRPSTHKLQQNTRKIRAVCAFTSFACVWWSEHCRLYPIPTTWAALKTAMRTRWVPPYYQRELLQKLQRLRQGNFFVEE